MDVGTINKETLSVMAEVIDLRRAVHREPEIGLDLPKTQAKIIEALEGLGLQIETGRGQTSVVATLKGVGPGKTIILRGDMDALPMPEDTGLDFASEHENTMHACGHDSHVAMLFGAAKVLSGLTDSFNGTIKFFFQPGEEGYGGAKIAIEEGLLDGDPIDGAFALHIEPTMDAGTFQLRPGPWFASSDEIHITIMGKGGHASAPYMAVDPIVAAASLVSELQTVVTRSVNIFDPAVVTITSIQGGTATNVIPESVKLMGTIRALSAETREAVRESVKRVAQSVASTHSCTAEVVIDEGYPVTVNDPGFTEFAVEVLGDLVGPENIVIADQPIMGSEDWSYVLEKVPGVMTFLGVRPEGVASDGAPACHSNRMILDEAALATGVAAHCQVALRFLAAE